MTFISVLRHGWLGALLAAACLVSSAGAEELGGQPQTETSQQRLGRPLSRLRDRLQQRRSANETAPEYRATDGSALTANPRSIDELTAAPDEHPLMPAIRWAREQLQRAQQIQDYSAIMVKRERVNGELGHEDFVFVKIRHQPFSVYMYFLKPQSLEGQEVIWIPDQNDGKMWAHSTGVLKVFGTQLISPTSALAMRGNRHPITEIGIENMLERLIDIGERDAKYGECEVKYIPGAKINGRVCTCIQVMHPVPRSNFVFHVARIFVDDELCLPVRYEAYDWPTETGGPPELMEEYTFLNVKLNNGFTDKDFDVYNENYGFKPRQNQTDQ